MAQHPIILQGQPTNISETNSSYNSETESFQPHGANDDEDDEEWIDFNEDEDQQRRANRKLNAGATSRPSPRKRVGRKVVGARKDNLPSSSRASRPTPNRQPSQMREVVLNNAWDGITFGGLYTAGVIKDALKFTYYPAAFFVCFIILTYMVGYVSQSLYRAFQPACIIPGISSLPICRPPVARAGNTTPQWADYPALIKVQSKSFEQLLDESVGNTGLSLEIKKVEMATSDLVALVRISDLNSKDSLVRSLSEFIQDAKKTGTGLQKLTSKVGGAVDNIMAVNDYALAAIESARANEPSPWSLQRVILWEDPRQKTQAIVTKTFEEAMNVLSINMERLILEAEINLHNLNTLEERLATLHDIIAREDSTMSDAKAELLDNLWARLGWNRGSLRSFDRHLKLLKGLGTYRKQALAHVVGALQTLRAMSADMEDMRERVAAPDLIGSTVPVEVHMKSIQMGLDRLHEGRIRAKKLEEDAIRKVMLVGDGSDEDEA